MDNTHTLLPRTNAVLERQPWSAVRMQLAVGRQFLSALPVPVAAPKIRNGKCTTPYDEFGICINVISVIRIICFCYSGIFHHVLCVPNFRGRQSTMLIMKFMVIVKVPQQFQRNADVTAYKCNIMKKAPHFLFQRCIRTTATEVHDRRNYECTRRDMLKIETLPP